MRARLLIAASLVLAAPAAVHAQSFDDGVKKGSAVGNKAAGPIGGAVGSVIGGVSGGVASGVNTVLGLPQHTGSVSRHRTPQKKPLSHRR